MLQQQQQQQQQRQQPQQQPPPRPRQVSPLSVTSNDSNFLSRYQGMSPDSPYGMGPGRGPASSTSPVMLNQPRTLSDNEGYPGPNMSRSPGGSQLSAGGSVSHGDEYGGMHSPVLSDVGQVYTPQQEEELLEHHRVLRGLLASFGNDPRAKSTQAAREKLMRLSPTQFRELSTDIHDESLRREDDRSRKRPDVPQYLLPSRSFHPKRNQARAKLAALTPDKFRQLSSDVFAELERRVPRFGGNLIERSASPMSMTSNINNRNNTRSPLRANPPMSPGQAPGGWRVPVGPSSASSSPVDGANVPDRPTGVEYSRPTPKTFQSNTIVPNKATMVEEDETDEEDGEDPRRQEVRSGRNSSHMHKAEMEEVASPNSMAGRQEMELEVKELHDKLQDLEARLEEKDETIKRLEKRTKELDASHAEVKQNADKDRDQHQSERSQWSNDRDEWNSHRDDLDRKLDEYHQALQDKNQELQKHQADYKTREVETAKRHDKATAELTSRIDTLNSEMTLLRLQGGSQSDEDLEGKCQQLQQELAHQQQVTEDVRENATNFLREMRILSEHSDAAADREERLKAHVSSLQEEMREWRARYAKARTELRTLKASSIGLPLQNMNTGVLSARQHFLSPQGVVHDVDITHFQMSIDELLRSARQTDADTTISKMKTVVGNIQHMTAGNEGDDFPGLPSPADSPALSSPRLDGSGGGHSASTSSNLKARVARNATGLITATRNYISSDGMSPVSLVDAAAANLTAAVIDYVKTVGIKPSTSLELYHDVTDTPDDQQHQLDEDQHKQEVEYEGRNHLNVQHDDVEQEYAAFEHHANERHDLEQDAGEGLPGQEMESHVHHEQDLFDHHHESQQQDLYGNHQHQYEQQQQHHHDAETYDKDEHIRPHSSNSSSAGFEDHQQQQYLQPRAMSPLPPTPSRAGYTNGHVGRDQNAVHQPQPQPHPQQQQQQQQQHLTVNGSLTDGVGGAGVGGVRLGPGGAGTVGWHSRLKGSFDSTYSGDEHGSGDEFS